MAKKRNGKVMETFESLFKESGVNYERLNNGKIVLWLDVFRKRSGKDMAYVIIQPEEKKVRFELNFDSGGQSYLLF